jgi:hypothetical protein
VERAAAMRRGVPPLVIVAAVLAGFLPALHGGFVAWDDDLNFTENPNYRGLAPAQLGWMLTTFHGGHYQPLTWVTLALDHAVWGMDPTGYHLTSVLLHAVNAVLVYRLVIALLARTSLPVGGFPAAAGALFFAIHPLRVESVAWASERRDVLSGLFWLLALLAYLRMQEGSRTRWYLVSLGCFALSLLSKAWGITLPLVLVALDAYPLGRFAPGRARLPVFREKVPYAILAVAGAALAAAAVRPIAATRTLAEHGVLARAAQAAYGLWFYLGKTVAPVRLSPLYLLELRLDPTAPRYVAALVGTVVATAVLALGRRRWPWATTAAACYTVVVSPVLGFVQTGPQIAADRYTYLACLPWAVLLAAGVARLGRGGPALRAAGWGASAVGLVVLGVLTYRQTGVWRDSRTLWEHALQLDPRSWVAYTNRGVTRDGAGDHDGALADWSAAIAIHPGYALAWYDRGSARRARGDLDGALADLNVAIALNPRDARTWNNRGWAREMKGDVRGAAADYAEALRVAPPDFPGRAMIEENLAALRALGADR